MIKWRDAFGAGLWKGTRCPWAHVYTRVVMSWLVRRCFLNCLLLCFLQHKHTHTHNTVEQWIEIWVTSFCLVSYSSKRTTQNHNHRMMMMMMMCYWPAFLTHSAGFHRCHGECLSMSKDDTCWRRAWLSRDGVFRVCNHNSKKKQGKEKCKWELFDYENHPTMGVGAGWKWFPFASSLKNKPILFGAVA